MIELIFVSGLAACLVAAATLASRVWGHGVGGMVGAFPLIVGPVLFLAAERQGPAFAARTANATLLGLVALSGFAVAYGRAARRWDWPFSVALGWAAAAVIGVLAGRVGAGPLGGLAAAAVSITLARCALPSGREPTLAGALPRWEMPARMALTALLIVALTRAGERFGATVAGILAALPTVASVLATFTHARHGHDALLALLRGMLSGLAGFVVFCATIALVIEPAGMVPAFLLATAAAVLLQAVAARLHAPRLPAGARSPVPAR